MPKALTQRVVFQPDAYHGLQKGINLMVDIVRPTLGPSPRNIAIERMSNKEAAELLDDGGTITRRIIQFEDRDADMGAMLVRHLLWRIQEQVGDATATAATLFQAVYNRGLHYIVAGGNPMQLRRYLERGANAILAELDSHTLQLAGKAKLAQLAESICHDPALAALLGEILDIVGEHGHVDIRRGHGLELERHYVEGMFWESSAFSAHMFNNQAKQRADLQNAALLITDLAVNEPRALLELLDLVQASDIHTLVVVATELSESSIALLLQASREPDKFHVVAVKTPGLGTLEQAEAMEDLAVLTGGRPVLQAAGDTFRSVTLADFGHARRVWVDQKHFGVVAGKGDPRLLRRHIGDVRSLLTHSEDEHVAGRLRQRVSKLMGGSATLLLGNFTEAENTVQEAQARRTITALRAALHEGVLLGAGQSLLNSRAKLQQMFQATDDADERAAYRILTKVLEEPLRTIAYNAGYEPGRILAECSHAEPGLGFDARCGQVVNLAQAGIFDVAAAQKAAVYGAITSAAQALTIDVLIHSKHPQYVAGT